MANITLFAQAIGKLPKENIRKIIRTAGTDKHCKGYDTWSQLVSMVFCQFSRCDSVRDISNGLKIGDWQPQSLRDKPCPKQIYGCVSKLKPQQRVQGHLLYALSRENRPRKVAERTIHTSSGHVHDYIGWYSGNVFHKVLILCAILHALKIFRTTLIINIIRPSVFVKVSG